MTIKHKYKVGDKVKIRENLLNPTCGLLKLRGQVVEITGIAPSYNNRPHYYVAAADSIFPERVFEGLATEPVNSPSRDEAVGADTLQGLETKCDTGDSGESEDRTKYRELYLKALKKTYGKVPFETETVEVGSLLEFTEAVLETTKEV